MDKEAQPDGLVGRGKVDVPSQFDIAARTAKEQVVYTGFVAQDVEKAAKELNYNFSGVDAAKNDKDLYGLRYAEFVVPLVKAVQELSNKNDSLQQQVNELKSLVRNNNQHYTFSQAAINTSLSDSLLEQNIPNPFANTTTIRYNLPQSRTGETSAQIVITDKNGKIINQINISCAGKGAVTVDASKLSSGSYHYSLVVGGKLISTKQMLLAK